MGKTLYISPGKRGGIQSSRPPKYAGLPSDPLYPQDNQGCTPWPTGGYVSILGRPAGSCQLAGRGVPGWRRACQLARVGSPRKRLGSEAAERKALCSRAYARARRQRSCRAQSALLAAQALMLRAYARRFRAETRRFKRIPAFPRARATRSATPPRFSRPRKPKVEKLKS